MKKYIMNEYRDSFGTGSTKCFIDKQEAISYTEKAWNAMCEKDKDSYRKDVVGEFRLYTVDMTEKQWKAWEDGEFVDIESYETEEILNELKEG